MSGCCSTGAVFTILKTFSDITHQGQRCTIVFWSVRLTVSPQIGVQFSPGKECCFKIFRSLAPPTQVSYKMSKSSDCTLSVGKGRKLADRPYMPRPWKMSHTYIRDCFSKSTTVIRRQDVRNWTDNFMHSDSNCERYDWSTGSRLCWAIVSVSNWQYDFYCAS